jgi:hypothetical protein
VSGCVVVGRLPFSGGDNQKAVGCHGISSFPG